MKIEDIRNLPDEDIRTQIDKARKEIFKLKFQAKGAGIENPGQYKELRKDVARFHTVLQERADSQD